MLSNLESVRREKGITLADMADLLHLRYQTVSDKISGVSDFKFGEALKLQRKFFPEYDLIFLFSPEPEKQTT